MRASASHLAVNVGGRKLAAKEALALPQYHERSSTTNLAIEGTHYLTNGLTLDTGRWPYHNPAS